MRHSYSTTLDRPSLRPSWRTLMGFTAMLFVPGLAACENSAGDPEAVSDQEQEALQAKPSDNPSPSPTQNAPSGTAEQRQIPDDPRAEQATGDPSGAPPAPGRGAEGADAAPQATGSPRGAGAAQQGDVSDSKEETFVEAYTKAQKVQQGLRKDLAGAKSEEKALAIQQQATQKMEKAVESTGMKFETYASLTRRLQSDAEFRSRVQETIKEMQSPS